MTRETSSCHADHARRCLRAQRAELIQNGDGTTSFLPNANIFLAALATAVLLALFLLILDRSRKRS